ncbi:DUF115 domain-containing protein [Paenibacillus sepulcri]|uniref:DUF115 domain-containing protein n=1 Tax=Paenibacillus sepulcri TaxID=359917 RepID=A0ABS7C6I5_9BACL|nr:DUF115 domain-containing protein [Paenibacillus sepulcri]
MEIPLHDPSDPHAEAGRLLAPLTEQLSQPEHHVLFFGAGLGYHIKLFASRYPGVPYSIYEPSAKVLKAFLSEVSLEDLNMTMLRNLYFGFNPKLTTENIKSFIYQAPGSFTVITLPSYVKLFSGLHKQFLEGIQAVIKYKQQSLVTNHHYEKKWILNSFRNFKYTLNTPSIFDYRKHFENKPVLLVAAGPSLQDEIENLRQIKENGTAYIFCVGSAINCFIENGLIPDAAFTYDPSTENKKVFSRAINENTTGFPLVYGTTVGEDTLDQFPWDKIHIPINQDPIYSYYFKPAKEIVLQDAPSIAVITLQVLLAMKCSAIILVGQNFAYRDNQFYSKGVPYGHSESPNQLTVPGVNGTPVKTTASLDLMRKEMEHYIRLYPQAAIINTTQDGASILGAKFQSLTDTMQTSLTEKVVSPNWSNQPENGVSDHNHIHSRKQDMLKQYQQIKQIFIQMQAAMLKLKNDQSPALFQHFDELFKTLQQNMYFQLFLRQMNRVRYEQLYSKTVTIKIEKNAERKAALLLQLFGQFLYDVYEDFRKIQPYFDQLNQTIDQLPSHKARLR